MIDEQTTVAAERLRDDLTTFRTDLRRKYTRSTSVVTSEALKKRAVKLAETWLVDIGPISRDIPNVPADYVSDLSVEFQRLLTFSERGSQRVMYDRALARILNNFTARFVVPSKQLARGSPARVALAAQTAVRQEEKRSVFAPTAFVAHSFAPPDRPVAECVVGVLGAIGIRVETGEKPQADRISDKVRRLIDSQHVFVGVFTRRDRISRSRNWTTSSWVIDEKAYAWSKGKRLILLREADVDSIGGLQGDYEYSTFTRDRLDLLARSLLSYFDLAALGLRR